MISGKPPRIEGAPGLSWRRRKGQWTAYWVPQTPIVRRGYYRMTWRIWGGIEPDESESQMIADICTRLQSEMREWARDHEDAPTAFEGNIKGLARYYQRDKDSRYCKVRYRTRIFYDRLLARIVSDVGGRALSAIKPRDFLRWHEHWSTRNRVAYAHALMGMLRSIFGYGATFLEDADCMRLRTALSGMKFEMPRPRKERLTAEQAIAIRAKAHEMGYPSIALAQAIQFELMLRQKDVIGEWLPTDEQTAPMEISERITDRNQKWHRGIRWSEIDSNMILRHTTSKRLKEIEMNLRLAPMVMEELDRLPQPLPLSGPVIVCDRTGLPWNDEIFRQTWRKIATAAGLPKEVRNMDSRAGGITEATDAGADLEHVRHAATHSDIKMTMKYSRGAADKTAQVMQKRVAHRNKKGT